MPASKKSIFLLIVVIWFLASLSTSPARAGTHAQELKNKIFLPITLKNQPLPPAGLVVALPGIQSTAMAVDQQRNRVYLADDDGQSIRVLDGFSNQVIATIPNVGGSVFGLVLNETHGKLYAASSPNCCTTGLTPGTGQVAVINVNTNQVIQTINPGSLLGGSLISAIGDEVHDKVYINTSEGTGVIDVALDTYTLVPGTRWCPYMDNMAINTVLNEVYVPCVAYGTSDLQVVHGDTLQAEILSFPAGATWPLGAVANERENKVYVTLIYVPNQGEMGIYILDRDTGVSTFVGKEDLEPLAYNPISNQVFSGVQIGQQAGVIEGATDQFTYVPLEVVSTGGIGAIDVRWATNHAYMASTDAAYVVSGATKTVIRKIPSNIPLEGGIVTTLVGINQTTGRVYMVFDDRTEQIFVFQD